MSKLLLVILFFLLLCVLAASYATRHTYILFDHLLICLTNTTNPISIYWYHFLKTCTHKIYVTCYYYDYSYSTTKFIKSLREILYKFIPKQNSANYHLTFSYITNSIIQNICQQLLHPCHVNLLKMFYPP